MPSLTLPQFRQRHKNIYSFLPRRQEELGRHQSRNIRIFSTESLLSRHSDSPTPEHMPSRARTTLQALEARACPLGYVVGVYDNAMVPQVCETLTPSAQYVNMGAFRDDLSTSSEDSRDYVNVPGAEETAETLTSSSPENLTVLPGVQEVDFTEKRDVSCGSDCIRFGCPGTESRDKLSDEESSSQTSNDYVNMSEFYLEDTPGEQPWTAFRCCRDYENVPPANANGSHQQVEEEVTSLNTDHVEGWTDAPESCIQPVEKPGRFPVPTPRVPFQQVAQSGNSQMMHEELLSEDDGDYENVLPTMSGTGESQQRLHTQKPRDVVSPAASTATLESGDGDGP
ncbi:PREDICTED: lymphocyte transmembrane adapter 1-like [Elephantulus edwardii]|uniref:lymphocyte transmembrane adapter 1-like n=1 Tax=Elephantulus edwardii TaxID=28737 RepID=UPI0003F0B3B6|nr:PREDICTED: lymphocyte transmembrane adapter 1-like [Elephantulus edwardii]